jgi:ABC transport system ATP-binding/permease protein
LRGESLYSELMVIRSGGSADDGPPLHVYGCGLDRLFEPGPSYRIGRNTEADVVLEDPRVSWQHAVLRWEHDGWLLEDTNSRNGTFLGPDRVESITISGECEVRFGHPHDGPAITCSPGPPPPGPEGPPPHDPSGREASIDDGSVTVGQSRAPSRPPSSVMSLPPRLRIGRSADNDIVVDDLSVSRHHAELCRTRRGYEIVDLDSHNGTFLNGQQVSVAPVREGDLIGVGPATFRMVAGELQEFLDTGDISLAARDLTVRLPDGKVLLDHVSFPLGERCLLAVIGPAGAGKSTLLGALTGIRPATAGSVLYDNRDLYADYAELRYRIGLVPQENILHAQLTAQRALGYAAELRFARDTSKAERDRRVREVLDELAMTRHAQTRTSSLSGGQQKRVNVALELLTKPSLLFLDEPTSGLDAGLDKSVMQLLADMAHDGRTVIVVTHSVANLSLCDRLLVLAPGGTVAYFGPPDEGLRHFGQPDWADVFQAFEAEEDRDWDGEFRRSRHYELYVTAGMEHQASFAGPTQAVTVSAPRNRVAQLGTLIRRYLAVIAADPVFLGFLVALPLVLGAFIRVVPDPHGLTGHSNQSASILLLLIVICACIAGTFSAMRELVKERPIFRRELAAGLSAGAYLASKLLVLGAISALQAVVMVAIGLAGRPPSPHGALLKNLPELELMAAVALLAVVSTALGLLISAAVNTSETAIQLLIAAVIFEVVMTGGFFALSGKPGLELVASVSPSRWGYAAIASTADLNVIQQLGVSGPRVCSAALAPSFDALWRQAPGTWLADIAWLLLLGAAFTLITWWRLIRFGPGRRR